jgi:osmotically inducible lipoprotein OsmB
MGARIVMRKTSFLVAAAATLPLLAGACSVDKRTGERTLTGAAVGAAGGAAVGLLSGGFLSSALTGAAAGAAGGFVYDQIKKD